MRTAQPPQTSRIPFLLLATLLTILTAQSPGTPISSPVSPEQASSTFETAPGISLELVASEPLTASPCAIAFDSKGRLFVAENRGYPIGPNPGEPPVGIIALLEDSNHDGRMDRRTVFADGLTFPNGVLPWKDGVIVTCAPDVLFLRDSKGTGRADEKRVLLTGFSTTGSTQLRVNSPTIGPDGWIYLAAGLSGGTLTCPEHPERPPLKMTADVRFHPDTLVVENVDGRSQYGMSFDDAGRRFICMNRLPVQHVVLSSLWLKRNPRLPFSETVQDCSERTVQTLLSGGGSGVRLFPISSNLTTADSHAGSFSAACGIHIWRGGALPELFRGAALSCDPTGNLVHADRLVPRGATFSAEPLLQKRELLASRDDWFRPVFLAPGPDGALYIADMYRKTIEHPDYIPAEVRKHADFESGKNLGRIWRLSSSANPPQTLSTHKTPLQNSPETLFEKECLESVSKAPHETSPETLQKSLKAAHSTNPRSRFLAALTLGNSNLPESSQALASIAAQDAEDRWTRAAVLSGIAGRESAFLKFFLKALPQNQSLSIGSNEILSFLASTFPSFEDLCNAIDPATHEDPSRLLPLLQGFCDSAKTPPLTTHALQKSPAWLNSLLPTVLEIARDPKRSTLLRLPAIRLLRHLAWESGSETLESLATTEPSDELRSGAIKAFAAFERPEVAQRLLALWKAYSPNQRETVLQTLLNSSYHTKSVLDAIESQTIPKNAISGIRRKQILRHKDPSLRQRAEKILSADAGDLQAAFERAKSALTLPTDSKHGRQIFQTWCASCHRLEQEGFAVGPDLFDIRNQPKENILFHIVVPDAEIAPAFTSYLAETIDGQTLSGILASETSNSITLRGPLATENHLLRTNLKRLEALPGSLMPSGLESALKPQDLADLLAFLKGER